MEIIYRKECPDLADRLAAVMSRCPNVSKAFRDAGVQPATAYAIIAEGKAKPSVEITALRDICRALGCTLQDLGVKGHVQSPQSISEAPVGAPVLGVWYHVAGNDFESCWVSRQGNWYSTTKSELMQPPDGFLPLPAVNEGGADELIEAKE